MRSVLLPLSLLLAACGESFPETFGAGSDAVGSEKSTRDVDGDGYSEYTGDCDETDANINPGETELCDDVDNDCDEAVDDDDNSVVENTWAPDFDGDGYNDSDGMVMTCEITSLEEFVAAAGGNLDPDEWSQVDDYEDADSDGDVDDINWDCDDSDANTYPDAPEVCDGADNDCDDSTVSDETDLMVWSYVDSDGDMYGDSADSGTFVCEVPSGSVEGVNTDCDDSRSDVNPGASESCDEADNNCDGSVDEGVTSTFYADADSDGYGDENTFDVACAASEGYVSNDTDCDDTNPSRNPGATEVCDADDTDEDCDGLGDDMDPEGNASGMTDWYMDSDADGYAGTYSMTSCDDLTGALSSESSDCDDDPTTGPSVNPDAAEVCGDGVDNDCDSTTTGETTWYHDLDDDSYGNADDSVVSCTDPGDTYVDNDDDCDDEDPDVNPEAIEVDGDLTDNDCNGLIDSDDPGRTCFIEYDFSTGSSSDPTTVTVETITGTMSDNSALDGVWYDSSDSSVSVSGVDVSATTTTVGQLFIIEFEHCYDSSTVGTLDILFSDGTHGCEVSGPALGAMDAYEDLDALEVYDVDGADSDGDGSPDSCVLGSREF